MFLTQVLLLGKYSYRFNEILRSVSVPFNFWVEYLSDAFYGNTMLMMRKWRHVLWYYLGIWTLCLLMIQKRKDFSLILSWNSFTFIKYSFNGRKMSTVEISSIFNWLQVRKKILVIFTATMMLLFLAHELSAYSEPVTIPYEEINIWFTTLNGIITRKLFLWNISTIHSNVI